MIFTDTYIGCVPEEQYLESAPKIKGCVVRCIGTGYYYTWTGASWDRCAEPAEDSKNSKIVVCKSCGNPTAKVGATCKHCRNRVTDEN